MNGKGTVPVRERGVALAGVWREGLVGLSFSRRRAAVAPGSNISPLRAATRREALPARRHHLFSHQPLTGAADRPSVDPGGDVDADHSSTRGSGTLLSRPRPRAAGQRGRPARRCTQADHSAPRMPQGADRPPRRVHLLRPERRPRIRAARPVRGVHPSRGAARPGPPRVVRRTGPARRRCVRHPARRGVDRADGRRPALHPARGHPLRRRARPRALAGGATALPAAGAGRVHARSPGRRGRRRRTRRVRARGGLGAVRKPCC